MATPVRGRPMREAWLCSLADWTKVILDVAAPLIEVLVTPYVAVWLFGG